MRRFLFVLALLSSPAFAQSEFAADMAALRQLVENQNTLIAEQSEQLRHLAGRVAELEGQSGVSEIVPTDESDTMTARTEAVDSDEISQQFEQSIRTGKESVIVDKPIVLGDTVDLYGSMRIFAETGDDDTTLNEGSSRIGIRAAREFDHGRTLFGRLEWKTNLVEGNSRFVVSEGNSEGIAVGRESSSDALTTRLGYLGMRFDNVGELTFGKQWSVYYDVAEWTDMYNVYGGSALSVYAAGTDGGALGTGRADNAIIWRNTRGKLSYGLQTQLQTTSGGDDYKGLGGSLIISPNDNWRIGAAFMASRIEGPFETLTGDDKSGVATVGVRYDRGPWYAAFNIAKWDKHESIFFVDDTLIYDGAGAELYVDYQHSDRLHLYGGFNYADPDINDARVHPDFGLEQLLFGASWFATDESFAYLEALLQGGKDVNGSSSDSVLSAGYRFDF